MRILNVLNVEMKDFDMSQKVEKNSLRKKDSENYSKSK